MKFAQPIWLLAGLIACAVLLWRYRRFDDRQRHELARFASASLIAQLTASVSVKRRRFKRALVILGVACLSVALARPLAGFRWQEANRKGLDLLFAVDTSKSMLAQDVKPDRLRRAKMAVEDLLEKLDGDRAGLIAFAGNAFLQCPLTLDYDAFRQSLEALDITIIPRGGTDIGAAIHEAEAAFEGKGNNEHIVVLLTDGEDLEGSALQAARAAAKKGLKIFTVGVGTSHGELIPLSDENGGNQFTKDASGQFVKSRLDEPMLKQIAEATGAMYQPLGQDAQGLETIYQKGLAQFTRHHLASRTQKIYIERFQWPLALGLLCLVLEPLFGIRRRSVTKPATQSASSLGKDAFHRVPFPRPHAAAAVLALLALATSTQASPRAGEKAFQKGDFSKAEQEYRKAATKNPDKPVLQFNHGSAAYKASQFDAAAQSFSKAMKTDDLKLRQDDYYNLGNTEYRLGQKTEKTNPEETRKTWEKAVGSYEAALKLKPKDTDAKYNRDLVKRKLEELKKQQKEQQQQNQQKSQQDNQSKSDDKQNQANQDQNKSDNKKAQQNKQSGGSGQQDNQDKKKPDQNNPDQQQAKDQTKPEDKKDQEPKQNASSGQPEKQDQPNQKSEEKNHAAQPDQKPEQAKKDGQAQARNPQPNEESRKDPSDAQPEPGRMSREEARQLLDSLKSGDRKMPLTPYARGNGSARDDEPLKDW